MVWWLCRGRVHPDRSVFNVFEVGEGVGGVEAGSGGCAAGLGCGWVWVELCAGGDSFCVEVTTWCWARLFECILLFFSFDHGYVRVCVYFDCRERGFSVQVTQVE